jgi:hypothetical protein
MTPLYRAPLATPAVHVRRIVTSAGVGLALIAISLGVGIAGYVWTEGLDALDAFVNAAMIISGMGPLHSPHTTAGKLFAGIYAIYCGFAVLGIAAIMFAPIVHRVFHRMHIDDTVERKKA